VPKKPVSLMELFSAGFAAALDLTRFPVRGVRKNPGLHRNGGLGTRRGVSLTCRNLCEPILGQLEEWNILHGRAFKWRAIDSVEVSWCPVWTIIYKRKFQLRPREWPSVGSRPRLLEDRTIKAQPHTRR
jgi:hypothetical protein